jgi:tellurite resistance protein TerC
MDPKIILLSVLAVTVAAFLVADLGFFNRTAHKIAFKSALLQSLFWIGVSLIFAVFIYVLLGVDQSTQFLTAYVTEKMLSVDNLFVILLIFNFFKLDEKYHHRVLFWGILGAIVFRGLFILTGSIIIEQFHWVLYIFGAILLYTGFKLLRDKKEEHVNYHDSKVLKFARKFLPFTTNHHEGKFFVREQGKLHATILFAIILLVETTDIVFAIDSIPAAFSISQDPFIVFTSNIFAIMGLRALFFLIEHVIHRFHHLQKALSFILVFIGSKMLLGIFDIHISSVVSFSIIMGALALALILSLVFPKKL